MSKLYPSLFLYSYTNQLFPSDCIAYDEVK